MKVLKIIREFSFNGMKLPRHPTRPCPLPRQYAPWRQCTLSSLPPRFSRPRSWKDPKERARRFTSSSPWWETKG